MFVSRFLWKLFWPWYDSSPPSSSSPTGYRATIPTHLVFVGPDGSRCACVAEDFSIALTDWPTCALISASRLYVKPDDWSRIEIQMTADQERCSLLITHEGVRSVRLVGPQLSSVGVTWLAPNAFLVVNGVTLLWRFEPGDWDCLTKELLSWPEQSNLIS